MKNKFKLNSSTLLVFILTTGVFGIINTEMGVIGILPLIAENFQVTVPEAGWTVSIFALVVAISAPITPLLFSSINRKKVMILVLGLFTLSNIISMMTTNFTVLLISRALPAFLHPVYVSMAFTVAAASVSKEKAPKAVAKVFIGVSAGMVLGVPVTSYIASEVSYSMGMLFFTVVNALVLVATILFVPSMPVKEKLSYGTQLSVLKKKVVWYSILAITLINGALFGFFSYMSDYLKTITGVSYTVISTMLLIYGLANIIGNVIAGKQLAVNPVRSMIMIPLALLAFYIRSIRFGGMADGNGSNHSDPGNSGRIRTEHHAIYDNACRSRSTGFCQRTVFIVCQSRYYSRCSRLRIVYHLLQYTLFRHRISGIPCFKHCIHRIKNTCYTIRKTNQNGNGCIRNKKRF